MVSLVSKGSLIKMQRFTGVANHRYVQLITTCLLRDYSLNKIVTIMLRYSETMYSNQLAQRGVKPRYLVSVFLML